MKTSTEICSASRIVGEERAIELLAKAGFDAWDFSMFDMIKFDWETRKTLPCSHPLAGNNYLAFARKLKQIGLDNGIICNQSHAPFPSTVPAINDLLKRAIECTAEAGGTLCVIHPGNDYTPTQNAEMYSTLLPFAKDHGVRIATENMWNWDSEKDEAMAAACSDPSSFNENLDAVNDPFFVACLDIGHAAMKGLHTTPEEMILSLGSRLQALHIHDNDCWHDSHQLPMTMSIDFDKMVKALKAINYQGYFTLEADAYLHAFNPSTIKEGIQNMADTARKLANAFEG